MNPVQQSIDPFLQGKPPSFTRSKENFSDEEIAKLTDMAELLKNHNPFIGVLMDPENSGSAFRLALDLKLICKFCGPLGSLGQSRLIPEDKAAEYRAWIIHSLAMDIFHTLTTVIEDNEIELCDNFKHALNKQVDLFAEITGIKSSSNNPRVERAPSQEPIARQHLPLSPMAAKTLDRLQTMFSAIGYEEIKKAGWHTVRTAAKTLSANENELNQRGLFEFQRRLLSLETLLLSPDQFKDVENQIETIVLDLLELSHSGTLGDKNPERLAKTIPAMLGLLDDFKVDAHKDPEQLVTPTLFMDWLLTEGDPKASFDAVLDQLDASDQKLVQKALFFELFASADDFESLEFLDTDTLDVKPAICSIMQEIPFDVLTEAMGEMRLAHNPDMLPKVLGVRYEPLKAYVRDSFLKAAKEIDQESKDWKKAFRIALLLLPIELSQNLNKRLLTAAQRKDLESACELINIKSQ